MRHFQRVVLRHQEGLIRQIRGLLQRRGDLDGTLRILLCLFQLLLRIRCLPVEASRDRLRHDRQHRRVVGIEREFFVPCIEQLRHLVGRKVTGHQPLIDHSAILALRVLLNELFAQLVLFCRIGHWRFLESLERGLLFGRSLCSSLLIHRDWRGLLALVACRRLLLLLRRLLRGRWILLTALRVATRGSSDGGASEQRRKRSRGDHCV